MKINRKVLGDPKKLQFMIIETWQGMDPTASYAEQAHALRRALDAVEYVEKAFDQGTVAMAHKPASQASTITIVAVKNLEELNDYIKGNAAHARVRPENRQVIPLCDWGSGRKTFEKLIKDLEQKAQEEQKAMEQGKFRPFRTKKDVSDKD